MQLSISFQTKGKFYNPFVWKFFFIELNPGRGTYELRGFAVPRIAGFYYYYYYYYYNNNAIVNLFPNKR